jgi:hypothetical protein
MSKNIFSSFKKSPLFWSSALYIILGTTIITGITFRSLVAGNEEQTVDQHQAGRVARLFIKNSASNSQALQPLSLPIIIDTGGAVISRAEVEITFEPELLKTTQLSFAGSSCASFTGQNVDETTGTISFTCERFNGSTSTQLQTLATISTTPVGFESPLLSFTDQSHLISSQGKEVLKQREALIVSLKSQVPASPALVPLAERSVSVGNCTSLATTSFAWLKEAGVTKFLYAWSDTAPITPTISTISTSIDVPLKPATVHFFTLRAVGDNGTVGPVRTIRVASCS